MSPPGGALRDVARERTDHLAVLHPDRALVLDAVPTVGEGDEYPSWDALLAAAEDLCPDGAWPLGPGRVTAAGRVTTVVARTDRVAGGAGWLPDAPAGLPARCGTPSAPRSTRTPAGRPRRAPGAVDAPRLVAGGDRVGRRRARRDRPGAADR